MYVAMLQKTVGHFKDIIDATIESVEQSRVNYIFRTANPYQRLISFLDGDDEAKDVVLKHRFYVEYKIKDVISK